MFISGFSQIAFSQIQLRSFQYLMNFALLNMARAGAFPVFRLFS
jgi:hypothetical protein